MTFTPLHKAVGAQPGPITDELLDAAVAAHTPEADDLDWKAPLPPRRDLPLSDFPKDVAAMANSGGGIIVCGVTESQKAAQKRVDVGELDENHERALRNVAVTAISPPIMGLVIHKLAGTDGKRAVVVQVPASVDVPHLIYRGECFGAPVRNDADTVWMKERQVEAMYRARFDERRRATDALDALYDEASAGRDTTNRAWLVAVAHPRIPRIRRRLSRDDARTIMKQAGPLALSFADRKSRHPLEDIDWRNPRPGLRRWVMEALESNFLEAWAALHHDGSVSLAGAIGGRPQRSADELIGGGVVDPSHVECAVVDLLAMTRTTAEATGNDEYDVRVGINWTGSEPLTMLRRDPFDSVYDEGAPRMARYTPVEVTLNASAPDGDFAWSLYRLVLDCVNQCGVAQPRLVRPPSEAEMEP